MSDAMLSFSEKIRRIYTEIVRRRSRVLVHPAAEVILDENPIFVIGPKRSGTTLVRYILDSHSRLCCPPETNFIGVLYALVQEESSRIGLAAMGFEEEHVIQKLRELGIYFWGNYARAKGKSRWADKSTSSVDHLEIIQKLFPEAQYLMIYRHGLDQAHSLSQGGMVLEESAKGFLFANEDPRISSVRYWAEKTQSMLNFEEQNPEKCVRILYEDLCTFPAETLMPVFQFLDEPWEPKVLEFYNFEHDKGPEHGRTIVTKGFSVSKDNYLSWPSQIIDACAVLAGPTLSKLGYVVKK